jgi:hypothetical protein
MTHDPDVSTMIYVMGALALYFLPAITAQMRGHHNTGAIFLTNLLLGWTALGWIAALIWSATAVAADGDGPIRLTRERKD